MKEIEEEDDERNQLSVSRLTVYRNGCNKSNLIQIVDDKDVSWLMLVMLKFSNNDLLVVVDSVFVSDVGNIPYLSSKLPRAQDSRNEMVIIDLDAFESAHTSIPIRVGSMFRNKFVTPQTFESSGSVERTYQSSAPEGCTYQSSAPKGCTHQSSAPEGCTISLVLPKDARISLVLPKDAHISLVLPKDAYILAIRITNSHTIRENPRPNQLPTKTGLTALPRPNSMINIQTNDYYILNRNFKIRLALGIYMLRCTLEDLYAMLSAFSDTLIRNNPVEEADDEGWFKFYFMALAASIDS
ncbi:NBS-LRR type resistance protein [Cucumis melo var. makuwa]|uniref:NBS-LRR type resistance protein n=1 Tax=Cucumis melo var. makuwa TaxID=1194695 RepID=A0A5D3C9C9_CUCMM|nr:NBS-LRR type resistance protein [Cucumis melo var. makuwa]